MIVTTATWKLFLNAIRKAPLLVYDTETTGLRPYHGDEIIGMAFGIPTADGVETYYVPFGHAGQNLSKVLLGDLRGIFADPNKVLLCWNAKFDMHMTRRWMDVKCHVLDAMLAFHLCNENEFDYGLKSIVSRYFGSEMVKDEDDLKRLLAARGLGKGNISQLTAEDVAPYAESDCALTYRVFSCCVPVLRADDLYEIFKEVCEYAEVMGGCERAGVLIDREHCAKQIEFATSQCQKINAELDTLTGQHVNPRSSPQMQKMFSRVSVDADVLAELQHRDDEIGQKAKLVSHYRGWAGAVSKFLQVFVDGVDQNDYLHANFNLHRVISGRLSCTNPNLQALSRVDEEKPWTPIVRQAIIAPKGQVLVSSDYSQAELRLLAHYTKDKLLMDAYADPANQQDIHQMVAEMIGIERYYAKRINFGMVYGMGIKEGVIQLKRPESQVKDILGRYNKLIPGIRRLQDFMEANARKNKYIKMWTGRRRRFNRGYSYHKAMSNLIQGGVAEIMRLAMTRLRPVLPEHSFMVLQVHDDIILQTPEEHAIEVAAVVRKTMEDFNFKVPMLVDQKIGRSWGTMVSVDKWKP